MTRILPAPPSFAPNPRDRKPAATVVFVEHDEAPATDIPPLLLLFSVCAGTAIWVGLIAMVWP